MSNVEYFQALSVLKALLYKMFYALNSLVSKGEHKPPFTLCIAANKTHLPQPSACLARVSKVVLHVPVVLARASVRKLT